MKIERVVGITLMTAIAGSIAGIVFYLLGYYSDFNLIWRFTTLWFAIGLGGALLNEGYEYWKRDSSLRANHEGET